MLAQGPPDHGLAPNTRIYFTSDSVRDPFVNYEVLSVRPDGTDLQRVTFDPGFDGVRDVSPDGQDVLFVSTRLGFGKDLYIVNVVPPAVVSSVLTGSGNDLFVIDPDGSGQSFPVFGVRGATWSQDGTLIYVHIGVQTHSGVNGWLYSINPDGSNLTFIRRLSGICHGIPLSLSPDGTQILCSGSPGISLLDLNDLSITNLTTNRPGVNDGNPAWSPDGNWIAFNSDFATQGNSQLFLMPPEGTDGPMGTNTVQLSSSGTHDERPTWSPDGQQIAFSKLDSAWLLYKIDIDGNEELVIGGSSQFARDPVWAIEPSPSSLADCQNGGWEALGFANQGACVRFLVTGRDTRP